jgi:aspartate/methionine/tyrosine aminotransferase
VKPARRLAEIKPSPIRVVSDGAPPGCIPLGLGEPGWDMPDPARRALAGLAGTMPYGPNAGIPELRDAIAAFHGCKRDEVLVTGGSQEALFAIMHAWVDPGDEVLLPEPGFAAYPALVKLCGGTVVPYAVDAADRFRLAAAPVIEALASHPKAKVVVVNHPANPTGAGSSAEALRAVADACAKKDVLLVSDEVYRELYLEARGPTLREIAPSAGLVVSSASKGFGSPGLRLGWTVGDARWLDPVRVMHGHAVTSAAIASQRAVLGMFERQDEVFAAARSELARRFEAIASACRAHLGLSIDPPDGAFYLWLPLPPSADLRDPIAWAIKTRDAAKVVFVPGIVFGEAGRGHARISYAAQPDVIAEGIRRLAPYWR